MAIILKRVDVLYKMQKWEDANMKKANEKSNYFVNMFDNAKQP